MAAIIGTDWWLTSCSFPDRNWARLRTFDNGRADAFDCDGATHEFGSVDEARSWLAADEFVALASMEEDELAEYGLARADVVPPNSRCEGPRLAGMLERGSEGNIEANPLFARLLLIAEDRFAIRGRGLLVVPGPEIHALPKAAAATVELHRPDGTRARARAAIQVEFSSPLAVCPRRWACALPDSAAADVPRGTELWLHPRFSD